MFSNQYIHQDWMISILGCSNAVFLMFKTTYYLMFLDTDEVIQVFCKYANKGSLI